MASLDEALHEEFSDLGDAELVPPEWVVENMLPVGMTVLIGAPKTHKSTILMMLATAVAGYKHKGMPEDMLKVPRVGRVLGLSAEASAGELRFMCEKGFDVRIEANGQILIADNPWSWRLDDDSKQRKMIQWLDDLQPRVTFIDPFRNFHTLDEKDSGIILALLTPLRQWHVKNKASLVLVHHTRKQASDDGKRRDQTADDARGSGALFGMADGLIVVNQRTGNRRQLDATFKRAPPVSREIMLGAWKTTEEPEKPQPDEEMAKKVLAELETLTWEQVMAKYGVSRNKLQEWKKRYSKP